MVQEPVQVEQMVGDEMQDRLLALDAADHAQNLRSQHRVAIGFGQLRPDDHIQRMKPVLQRQEHRSLGGAGPLAHRHQPGKPQPLAVTRLMRHRAGLPAIPCQRARQQPHGMVLQRQAEATIVGRHLFTGIRLRKHNLWLGPRQIMMAAGGMGEERQFLPALTGKGAHLPQRLPAVQPQAGKAVGIGNRLQRPRRDIGPPHDIGKRRPGRAGSGWLAAGGDALALAGGKTLDQPQAEPQRMSPFTVFRIGFQRAVPA